mmetsp:Transcript_62277/g.166520  ORF Transcript_62277/g.166520 Transcript_62277/m.166520 type:complete len:252 (-) Transcript_62277:216-971(-)
MAASTTNASTSRSRRSGVGSTKHQTPRSPPVSQLRATTHSLSSPSKLVKPLLPLTALSSFANLGTSDDSGAVLASLSSTSSCRKPRVCSGGSRDSREGVFAPLRRSRSSTGRPPGFVALSTKARQLSLRYSLACSTSSSSSSRVMMISLSRAFSLSVVSLLHSASTAFFRMASHRMRSPDWDEARKATTAASASSRRCCRLWSSSFFSASATAEAAMLYFLAVEIASFMAIVFPRFSALPVLLRVSATPCL